ncbi:uncharacterized protein LOC119110093 [Pollicipes pollicipes]|uniref:uncharacterized protein LOC119110093 n=1 Tax=Pollicipes pollicipes TaxID=41117 RepID=UPI001884B0F6|nr:uncharacterized protein LOC119110093 [Pollicipes pollicipes]
MQRATRFRVELGRQQASYVSQLQSIRGMLGSLQEQIRALYASLQRLPEVPAVEPAPALSRRSVLRRGARLRSRAAPRVHRSSEDGADSDSPPDTAGPHDTSDDGGLDGVGAGSSRTRPLPPHFSLRRPHARSASRLSRNHSSLRCAVYRLQHSLARCNQLTRQTQQQVVTAERQVRLMLRQLSGSEPLTVEQLRTGGRRLPYLPDFGTISCSANLGVAGGAEVFG